MPSGPVSPHLAVTTTATGAEMNGIVLCQGESPNQGMVSDYIGQRSRIYFA